MGQVFKKTGHLLHESNMLVQSKPLQLELKCPCMDLWVLPINQSISSSEQGANNIITTQPLRFIT